MFQRSFVALSLVVGLSLVTGCEDPAASAPKATVGSALPVSSAKPAASGAAAATAAATGAATAAAAPTGAEKPAGAIDLANGGAKIGFTGSKVTGKHDGEFQKVTGWLSIEGDKIETAKVYIEAEVASAKTDSPKLDGHLKSDDFFAADKHPLAKFTSTEIKAGGENGATHTITGNLELRGVTKSISFPAKIEASAAGVKATSEFSLNRKDFGVAYAGAKDDLIRDEVVMRLTIDAKK